MKSVVQQSQLDPDENYYVFQSGMDYYTIPSELVCAEYSVDRFKKKYAPNGYDSRQSEVVPQRSGMKYHRFCELVASCSNQDDHCAEIELLQKRKQDHVRWFTALENSLYTGVPFHHELNPLSCECGAWLLAMRGAGADLAEVYSQLDQLHHRIHALAQRLLGLAEDNDRVLDAIEILKEERQSSLGMFIQLLDQIEAHLRTIIDPSVVILKLETKKVAVELERAGRQATFSFEQWSSELPGSCITPPYVDGYFYNQDGSHVSKLNLAKLLALL